MGKEAKRGGMAGAADEPGALARLERRLAALEEQAYFQERQLEELNDALVRQQAQLDALERSAAQAVERLEVALNEKAEKERKPGDELPPHYGERRER